MASNQLRLWWHIYTFKLRFNYSRYTKNGISFSLHSRVLRGECAVILLGWRQFSVLYYCSTGRYCNQHTSLSDPKIDTKICYPSLGCNIDSIPTLASLPARLGTIIVYKMSSTSTNSPAILSKTNICVAYLLPHKQCFMIRCTDIVLIWTNTTNMFMAYRNKTIIQSCGLKKSNLQRLI